MLPDTSETEPCPQCSYSIPICIAVIGSICAFVLLRSIYRGIRSHCMLSGRFPFFSRQAESQDVIRSVNSSTLSRTGGLDSGAIIALPAVQFKKRTEDYDEDQNSECPICLGGFREGEWLRLLPNCAHAFHVSCIDIWLRSSSNCPVCRINVLNDDSNHQPSGLGTTPLETLSREEPHQETACHPCVVECEFGPTNDFMV